MDGDRQIIADAKANGFLDCRAVRDGLGWDKPNANGSYYSSLEVAFRWIEEADEEVVFLIPDGITDVTKSERTGCYPDAFAHVLAYKEEYYADLAVREKKSWDDALAQKYAFDKQKADELAALIARQEAASISREVERATRYAQIDAARDAEIQQPHSRGRGGGRTAHRRGNPRQAMREYTGPMNLRGTYPKGPFMGLSESFGISAMWKSIPVITSGQLSKTATIRWWKRASHVNGRRMGVEWLKY